MTHITGWKLIVRALSGTSRWRLPAALAFDAAVVVWCWHAAYLFRMGWERWQPARPDYDDAVLAFVVAAELACLWALGFYRMPWRFFGFKELTRLTGTFAVVGALLALAVMGLGLVGVARSVLILHPMFCVLALGISRMALRLLWEESQRRAAADVGARQAVVLCAELGPGLAQALKPIQASTQWMLLGAFCADSTQRGASNAVPGVKFLGDLADVPGHGIWEKASYVVLVRSGSPQDAAVSDAAYKTGKPVLPVDATASLSSSPPATLPH
jgi:FlaA1/EpsC-like NDP-sugar epimerase